MRYSVDIDGVLSSFTDAVIGVSNKVLPGKGLPKGYEPLDWNYTEVFDKLDWDLIWEEVRDTENFWVGLKEYEENVAALQKHIGNYPNQEVFFITSRTPTKGEPAILQSARWLAKRGLYIQGHVFLVKDPLLKAELMKSLGIDFSVDDYPPTVEACNKVLGHKAYLLDRSWNKDSDQPRVKNLKEFLDIISLGDLSFAPAFPVRLPQF